MPNQVLPVEKPSPILAGQGTIYKQSKCHSLSSEDII